MGARSGTFDKCIQTGKLCFETKGDALNVIKKPNVRGNNAKKRKKREKRAYLCEHCGNWHLTSSEYFLKTKPTLKPTKNGKRDSKRKGSEGKIEEGD